MMACPWVVMAHHAFFGVVRGPSRAWWDVHDSPGPSYGFRCIRAGSHDGMSMYGAGPIFWGWFVRRRRTRVKRKPSDARIIRIGHRTGSHDSHRFACWDVPVFLPGIRTGSFHSHRLACRDVHGHGRRWHTILWGRFACLRRTRVFCGAELFERTMLCDV